MNRREVSKRPDDDMTRCLFCRKRLWFWQSQGWLDDHRWHGRCYHLFMAYQQEGEK